MMAESQYHWIDQAESLRELADEGTEGDWLYLDTEFMRERTFWPELALVQVNTGRRIALVDPLPLSPEALRPLFRGRRLLMHGCSEDLEAIDRAVGELPDAVGDTQVAAALTGEPLQVGYQGLVEKLLGVSLAKGATRTNWLKRPLSAEQLEYAVDDVVYLPPLMECLLERLDRLGRRDWWEEECRRLLETAAHSMAPADAWRQVKGAGRLPPESLAVLQSLAAWREQAARERNLPRGFVIRDADLLQLARKRPGTSRALGALDLHPALVRRDGERLLRLIADAEGGAVPAPLPEPPDAAQREWIKRLRAEVASRAGELNLEPEVLMRRRWLEALVRDPDTIPSPLAGWRRPLVTEPLLEMLP